MNICICRKCSACIDNGDIFICKDDGYEVNPENDCEHFRDASEFHAGDTCPFCDGKLYRDGEKLKCSEHCDFDKVIW